MSSSDACCRARTEAVPAEITAPGECSWPVTDCWLNGPAAPSSNGLLTVSAEPDGRVRVGAQNLDGDGFTVLLTHADAQDAAARLFAFATATSGGTS